MNFNFSSDKKPLATYSLAGLTDIVLLLLVFFLLTSNFIPQFGIQINLPQAETSAPMDDRYVSVAITSDGQYYVNQNPVEREQLADALYEAKEDRTVLVLRADEEATVAQFALVANLARALDLRVLMATERGRP